MHWMRLHIILLVIVAVLPPGLHAQRQGGQGGGQELQAVQRNPIQLVLEARQELGLKADQVAELQKAQEELDEQNRPHLERIDSLQKATPRSETGNRAAVQEMMQQVRPLRQAIQENNRQALQGIRPHFTTEQWDRVNELIQVRRRPGGDEGRHVRGH